MRKTLAVLLIAGLVALAGCSAGPGGSDDDPSSGGSSGTATINFWVSDQPGAIEDFETLNVTVTRVGFKPANGTMNESTNDSENGSEAESGWVERDVNDTTVDLTELRGENASLVDQVSVPNGTYTKTVMYVSETNGTLTDGMQTNVKLPSEKLQLNSEFTAGANESVDFVFDIQVTKAGNSGKYVIRPVISQSGTEQPIRDVNGDADDDADDSGGPPDDRGNGGQGNGNN
jgi:hypothetical protein